MFVYILLTLSLLSLSVFLIPLRLKWAAAISLVTAGAIVSIVQAVAALTDGGSGVIPAGFSAIFGEEYFATDALSALFMIITSITAVSVTVYARGYLAPYLDRKSPVQISLHYASLVILFLSMIGVTCSTGGFAFLFCWELMTLSSFLLILFDAEREEVRRAAINYLVLMHIGFFFLLAGFVSLWTAGLEPSFSSLGAYFSTHGTVPLFLVFFVGFGMKAGMFPLHVWLPDAHPAAPSHVSAFMSGVMIKMGIYGIVRVCSYIQIPESLHTVGLIILITGIITALWGIILATAQNDIKRILAYSSIENVGIILTGLGIGLVGLSGNHTLLALCGIGGALLHTVNHAMFKSLLFMGAGSVYSVTHTTSLNDLGGLAKRMPVTATLFLIGVMSICALPPLSGFVSEFLIYFGLFDSVAGNTGLSILSLFTIISMALVGGIVLLAFSKLYGIVFGGVARSQRAFEAREVSPFMLGGQALPLACILIVGLAPFVPVDALLGITGSVFSIENTHVYREMFSADTLRIAFAGIILIAVIVVLYVWSRRKLAPRSNSASPTWGCGFTAPNHRMQYTGESFSEGLHKIAGSFTKNSGGDTSLSPEEIFPSEHDFDVKHKDKIDTLFSAWWIELISRINLRMRFFSTSKINYHILFALLFLALVLVLSILKVI